MDFSHAYNDATVAGLKIQAASDFVHAPRFPRLVSVATSIFSSHKGLVRFIGASELERVGDVRLTLAPRA